MVKGLFSRFFLRHVEGDSIQTRKMVYNTKIILPRIHVALLLMLDAYYEGTCYRTTWVRSLPLLPAPLSQKCIECSLTVPD